MEEDNITLQFNLADPVDFQIGDYVDDELFGRFYITEEPNPAEYNIDNGAYKYDLRFDRDYINWKNYIFQLTYTDSDRIVRKETTWKLTERLEVHFQELIRNLYSLGYTNYAFCIGDGKAYYIDENLEWVEGRISGETFEKVKDADVMALIEYQGTNLYDALKDAICKTYNCEFWVRHDVEIHVGDDEVEMNLLCLGKCEFGQEMDIKLIPNENEDTEVINAERISPSRSETDYANRLYVFGSTKNLPDTYRKKLEFEVKDILNDDVMYFEANQLFTRSMFYSPVPLVMTGAPRVYNEYFDVDYVFYTSVKEAAYVEFLNITFDATFTGMVGEKGDVEFYVSFLSGEKSFFTSTDTAKWSESAQCYEYSFDSPQSNATIPDGFNGTLTVRFLCHITQLDPFVQSADWFTADAALAGGDNEISSKITINNVEYPVFFNPKGNSTIGHKSDRWSWFKFVNTPPVDFTIGSIFGVVFSNGSEDGFDIGKMPSSFYKSVYGDLNSL